MFFHNLSVLLCEKVPHNQLFLVFYWFVCKLKYNEAWYNLMALCKMFRV